MTSFVLGTRGSELALVQTRHVAACLRDVHADIEFGEKIIKTTGDQRLDVSLSSPGSLDKGLFTKELEEALLRREVHAAVHSLKDLPTEQPDRLTLGAILEREDPADCLASKHEGGWRGLPEGATVATSSPRRKNQLLLLRPDLRVIEIRGNVPTRLRKTLETADLDALVLARAAVVRLGENVVPAGLSLTTIEEMLAAPGQGAIAVECCDDDLATLELLHAVHHEPTALCVAAERKLLQELGGGCHMPLGVRATFVDGNVFLRAALFHENGVEWIVNPPAD